MELWQTWFSIVNSLKRACARNRTFFWMIIFLMGVCTRCGDLAGVTSIIRVLGLEPHCYNRILALLHSPALNIKYLTQRWVEWALKNFSSIVTVNNRIVLLTDGNKVPKEGKKMPGVKSLHQESESNSKAEYIMGHSFQAIGIVVTAAASYFCVPLACQLHEGLVFSNRDKRTLYDKLLNMIDFANINRPYYLVADAYYSVAKMVKGMKARGNHLITRAKKNVVAYQIPTQQKKNKVGRPKKYGDKVKIRKLFKTKKKLFKSAPSPVYGEENVTIKFYAIELFWRASGELIQFVLVKHPSRGSMILISTDLECDPIDVIKLYGLRFKIEVTFKQAIHTVGVFNYRMWMKRMVPIKRRSGNQYLHRKDKQYRQKVKNKVDAYHRFVQLSFIAQGIMQYLSTYKAKLVWKNFGSWLRTIREGVPPSEVVTGIALHNTLPAFLASTQVAPTFKKFIGKRLDKNRSEGKRMVA